MKLPLVPLFVLVATLALTAAPRAAARSGSEGLAPSSQASASAALPPSEQEAKARLDSSPRHGEYADVKLPGSDQQVRTWVVYPERKDKAPVVIVIHEIYGLSDWIRGVADQLAAEGFIAVAPDLVSGMGPGGGGTESAADRDEVVKLVRKLTPAEVTRRLNAVRSYALSLPSANGRTATIGFCWGGGASFAYAAEQPALDAAVVYYGTPPDSSALASLKVPVLGFYGGDDARVTSTVEPTKAEMKRLGKPVRGARLPGGGPRIPAPAGRARGREHEGVARGLRRGRSRSSRRRPESRETGAKVQGRSGAGLSGLLLRLPVLSLRLLAVGRGVLAPAAVILRGGLGRLLFPRRHLLGAVTDLASARSPLSSTTASISPYSCAFCASR